MSKPPVTPMTDPVIGPGDALRAQAHRAIESGEAELVQQRDGNAVYFWVVDYEPDQTPRLDRLHGQRRWISYGDDNMLPHQIIDMGRLSTTHSAIINKKAEYTAGDDILFTDKRLEAFCNGLDGGEGLHSLLKKCAEDYQAFGAYSMQARWKKWKRELFDFRHQPWHELRMGFSDRTNAEGKYEQGVWLCYDWPRWTWGRKYNRPEFYRYFDERQWTDEPTFFVSQKYTQGSRYYPLPKWIAAYKDALTEVELVNFKYWSVTRGFAPAGMVRIFGRVNDERVIKLKEQIKDLGGTMNAGKLLVVAADSMDAGSASVPPVEFIPFNNNPAERDVTTYLEQGRQAIVTGHGLASATIIGINVSTGLQSDAATLALGLHELKRSVMKDQKHILRNINRMLALCGFPDAERGYTVMQSLPDDAVFAPEKTAAFRSSPIIRRK